MSASLISNISEENVQCSWNDQKEWVICTVSLLGSEITAKDASDRVLVNVTLDDRALLETMASSIDSKLVELSLTSPSLTFKVQLSIDQAKRWNETIRERLLMVNMNKNSDISLAFQSTLAQFSNNVTLSDDSSYLPPDGSSVSRKVSLKVPAMNIVILVVGTRGDVQPFVYLGQLLQRSGHRVRLATHSEYRSDVAKGGLEYYPLAGDPRKLSEYMVKTAGRLMPDLLDKNERAELPEKMKMLEEITFSCFPACTSPDPEDFSQRPFLADAIISNPVSYGHIHCAEALSIPLVISRLFMLLCFRCSNCFHIDCWCVMVELTHNVST